MSKIQKIADYFCIKKSDLIDEASSSDEYQADLPSLTDSERQLIENYRRLNPAGQGKASDYLDNLAASGSYAVSDSISTSVDNPILHRCA